MRKIILLFIALMLGVSIHTIAQTNPGDTLVVPTFNYTQTYGINQWSPGIRDTMIQFPDDSTLSFSKILMYYNMRCKDANVSQGVSGQTDKGCGEWDASCNTYIHDSLRVDSVLSFTKEFAVSNFSGSTFSYTAAPMHKYLRNIQKGVVINSMSVDSQYTLGVSGSTASAPLADQALNAKTQILYAQTELAAAGVVAGNIDGLIFNITSGASDARQLRICMKHSSQVELSDSLPELTGYSEVYFFNTNLQMGANRLQFYTPFVWDGTSNVIVELSYSNTQATTSISFASETLTQMKVLQSFDDNSLTFDGGNYAEVHSYKGVPGTQSRTMEAWIRTGNKDIAMLSWGENASGEKWIWRLDGTGGLRIEVNGGYAIGPTDLADGNWHHVAAVFNGTSTSDIDFYVDGVKETGLNVLDKAIDSDTTNGYDVRIAHDHHNRLFKGDMDNLRLWDTALTQSEIQEWMMKRVNSSHSQFSNLQFALDFDKLSNDSLFDGSSNNRKVSTRNYAIWNQTKGSDLIKGFNELTERPQTIFLQGTYNLTISNDTIMDTVAVAGHNVKQYEIISQAGTSQSDVIGTALDTVYWQAGYEYTYDALTGNVLDSILIPEAGLFFVGELSYFKRYPAKYEIMSFVTPYGINLDLGQDGKTWIFDVSDYAPILKGKKRMTIERGGQWMEDMDIRFVYIVGTPSRKVLDINQLWRADSKSYTTIIADRAFEKRDVMLNSNGEYFKLRSAISGHGQEGEFVAQSHYIDIDGGSDEFTWQVWKNCSDNPIYPQGGTWIYSRAGWCPGAATDMKEMDITPFVTAGQTSEIDYGVVTASGTSNYIVNNQLVTYGAAEFTLDAAVEEIQTPSSRVEYSRFNTICQDPTIVIKNTGTTDLTSLKIKYWVNQNTAPSILTWTGNLKFMETELVTLHVDSLLWRNLTSSKNTFHVEIEQPNGATDEYVHNNTYQSTFVIPDVLPSDFYIQLRTNSTANETYYKVYDAWNNVVLFKTGLYVNKTYRDTFYLGVGCYKIVLWDTDGDGLSFWNNNDGSGSFQLKNITGGLIKSFNGDFGQSLTYSFTVDYPLAYNDVVETYPTVVYPNPSQGSFTVDFGGEKAKAYVVYDIAGNRIQAQTLTGNYDHIKLNLETQAKGIYMLRLEYENHVDYKKLIIE